MVLSRLRRCFSPKSSPSTAYRRLHTPPPPIIPISGSGSYYSQPKPTPPSQPLPIYEDDRYRPESPPPIPIGDGDCGGGNEEKTSAMYRIENELRAMNEEAPTHCSFGPVAADIFRWEGVVIGPASSCYEGGIFRLSIEFPSDYPLSPPFIRFLTKIFHPNIGEDGTIYIDILNEKWSSALTIEKLLLSICSILSNPYPQDSINDWFNYNETAREWTKTYAMET